VFADGTPELRAARIEEAGLEEELRGSLLALAGVTALDTRKLDEAEVGAACLAVARYAEERGAPATRLAFMEVAAVAMPDDARLAFEVGKLARDSADYAAGEAWFRKAIKAAIHAKDRETYIWAFLGLAILYMRLGNYPASRAVTNRALRAARHHRLRGMAGRAYHHLFILEAESERSREAYEHAYSALQAYGREHPRLNALAHDVAWYWVCHGAYVRALPILEAVAPHVSDPSEQPLVFANLAWAAAGSGEYLRYEQTRRHALELLNQPCGRRRFTAVLATLACADASAGNVELAEKTAESALSLALRMGDVDAWTLAERGLKQARSRSKDEFFVEEMPVLARRADRLAGDLIRSLES